MRVSGAKQLPEAMLRTLIEARRQRGWSQAELGRRTGLPQVHISGIETGRVVPRFDTLLELVRVLGFDLLLVPQKFVPIVQALGRDPEEPLYQPDEDEEDNEPPQNGFAERLSRISAIKSGT